MGRLLAIDYGRRRCGIAATDPLRIAANGVATVATAQLIPFLKEYMSRETVDRIIVGLPRTLGGDDSESMRYIRPAVDRLRRELPGTEVEWFDERFTSTLAHRAMIDGGMPKAKRRDKAAVDAIAATIILNDYLNSKQYR